MEGVPISDLRDELGLQTRLFCNRSSSLCGRGRLSVISRSFALILRLA